MTNKFVIFKFAWLDQVVLDSGMDRGVARVAYRIATEYLNQKTRTAWPSVYRLAKDLGTSENAIRRATQALAERGHLEVILGGGRSQGKGTGGQSNVYRPIIKRPTSTEGSSPKKTPTATEGSKSLNPSVTGGSKKAIPGMVNPSVHDRLTPPPAWDEPLEEPFEGNGAPSGARHSSPVSYDSWNAWIDDSLNGWNESGGGEKIGDSEVAYPHPSEDPNEPPF